jgi:hypothetical protein
MDFRASIYVKRYFGYFLTLLVGIPLPGFIVLREYVLAFGLLIAVVIAVMRPLQRGIVPWV